MRYVDGTCPCPSTDPDKSDWVRADNTLMSLISATLTEPILATVIGCTSSADMWSILDEYFSQHSNANRATTRRSWLILSVDPARSLNTSARPNPCLMHL